MATDINDLKEVLEKTTESPSANKALSLLIPFISSFQNLSFKDNKDIAKFALLSEKFKPVLNEIGSLIKRIELEIGESRWYEFGFDRPSRIKAKYSDIVKDLEFIETKLTEISEKGQQASQQQISKPEIQLGEKNISEYKNILSQIGLISGKIDDNIDTETINATRKLEQYISIELKKIGIEKSLENKIIDNTGKLIMSPKELTDILTKIQQLNEK